MSENNIVSISQEDKIDILVADYEQKLIDLFEQEKENLKAAKERTIVLEEERKQLAYEEIKDSMDAHSSIPGYKWNLNDVRTGSSDDKEFTLAIVTVQISISFPGITAVDYYGKTSNAKYEDKENIQVVLSTVNAKNQEIEDNEKLITEIQSKMSKISADVRAISQKTRQLKASLVKQRIGDSEYQAILENPEVSNILKIEY